MGDVCDGLFLFGHLLLVVVFVRKLPEELLTFQESTEGRVQNRLTKG